MTCYKLGRHRELFAFPYPIIIWKEAPMSLKYVKDLVDSYGFTYIFTVGDVVTRNFLKHGISPMSVAVDGKTRREILVDFPTSFRRIIRVKNPPGYITSEAWSAVEIAVRESVMIKVEGEEDMLSLAFIKLAPPHSIVAYGHYLEGLVAIPVDWYRPDILKLFQYLDSC